MASRNTHKKKLKSKKNKKDQYIDYEDFYERDDNWQENLPTIGFWLLETYDNRWYERLVCKRLANKIKNRNFGMKARG